MIAIKNEKLFCNKQGRHIFSGLIYLMVAWRTMAFVSVSHDMQPNKRLCVK